MAKKQEVRKKDKDYKFEFKLYPDCVEYDCDEVIDKLKALFADYAYILHDHDERTFSRNNVPLLSDNKARHLWVLFTCKVRRGAKGHLLKPHYHFYGKNNHNRQFSLDSIVRYLEVPYKYAHNGDFRFVDTWEGAMRYTIHNNAPDKYQYSPGQVFTNIRDWYKKYIVEKLDSSEQFRKIVTLIEEQTKKYGRPPTYFEVMVLCNELGLTLHIAKDNMIRNLLYSYRHPEVI